MTECMVHYCNGSFGSRHITKEFQSRNWQLRHVEFSEKFLLKGKESDGGRGLGKDFELFILEYIGQSIIQSWIWPLNEMDYFHSRKE